MSQTRTFVHGHRPVEELLVSGRSLLRVWASPRLGTHRRSIEDLCRRAGIDFQHAPDARLASLCGAADHGGVVAETSPLPILDLEGLLALPAQARRVVFALDGVENPRNLGLVVRSLAATGCGPVLVPAQGGALPGAAFLEASAGYGHHVPMVRVPKLPQALERLKKDGYWVYGLDARGERGLFGHELAERTVFVMGNETRGLRPTVRAVLDQVLSIPVRPEVESLNVAVAASLCAFEALRAGRV